jgi:hypothetical protein
MHRYEVYIARGLEIEAPWMFWRGVLVEHEFAYPVEQRLAWHEDLDGYHYIRVGDRFYLPPIYKFETIEEEEEV